MSSFSDWKESKAFHVFKHLTSTVTCAISWENLSTFINWLKTGLTKGLIATTGDVRIDYRKTLSLPQKGDDGIWTQCCIAQEILIFLITKK